MIAVAISEQKLILSASRIFAFRISARTIIPDWPFECLLFHFANKTTWSMFKFKTEIIKQNMLSLSRDEKGKQCIGFESRNTEEWEKSAVNCFQRFLRTFARFFFFFFYKSPISHQAGPGRRCVVSLIGCWRAHRSEGPHMKSP